jgi:hypothetical protein
VHLDSPGRERERHLRDDAGLLIRLNLHLETWDRGHDHRPEAGTT